MRGGEIVRTDYVNTDSIAAILWALQPANSLVCEVALVSGWRIDDILKLKTIDISNALEKKKPCLTIIESKTKKTSRRYLSRDLLQRINAQAGQIYCFEGRDDYRKHRTRQAVFLDLKKCAKRFNIKTNLAPHSFRKNYAVYLKQQGKSLEEVQKTLNHSDIITTMIYYLSDEMNIKYQKKKHPKT